MKKNAKNAKKKTEIHYLFIFKKFNTNKICSFKSTHMFSELKSSNESTIKNQNTLVNNVLFMLIFMTKISIIMENGQKCP